jgi:hypothetical protein
VLKSVGECDDNSGVTIVIALQGLVGTLAGLLFLEARLRRIEHDDDGQFGTSQTAEIDFPPELIVAWDDEADYARERSCTRPSAAARRGSRRLQPVSTGSQHRR